MLLANLPSASHSLATNNLISFYLLERLVFPGSCKSFHEWETGHRLIPCCYSNQWKTVTFNHVKMSLIITFKVAALQQQQQLSQHADKCVHVLISGSFYGLLFHRGGNQREVVASRSVHFLALGWCSDVLSEKPAREVLWPLNLIEDRLALIINLIFFFFYCLYDLNGPGSRL